MSLPQPDGCRGCALHGIGQGFVLGLGDPARARLQIMCEAPYRGEVSARVTDEAELMRRRAAYPDLEERFIRQGAPLQAESGAVMDWWILKNLGVQRQEVFLDNTLRCALDLTTPKYPTGNVRKQAEAFCRRWDRFNAPTVSVVTIHPAAIARDPAPLPMVMASFRRALDFAGQGERPLMLCGGKAAQTWLGYGSNPTRWVNHYEVNDERSVQRRVRRIEEGLKVSTEKKVRIKKLTAKTALALLLSKGVEEGEGRVFNFRLMPSEYEEMLALTVTQPRVAKSTRCKKTKEMFEEATVESTTK